MPANPLDWESIASKDWFRTAEPEQQNQLARAWSEEIAPQLYPAMQQDPEFRSQIRAHAYNFRLPEPVEGEQEIITPETLNLDGISRLENNPEFARKSRREQQQIRQTWFQRLTVEDDELRSMDPEQQATIFERVMSRRPVMDSPLFGGSNRNMVDPLYIDADQAAENADVASTLDRITANITTGLSSYIVGPIRKLMGEDSLVGRTLKDLEKQTDFHNVENEAPRLLAQTLPAFAGNIAGLMNPASVGVERALAGTRAGGKYLPGLFEQAGRTVTSKVPSLAYRTAGSATAGALRGISRALAENDDWKKYLAEDATIGVGIDFASHYLGALRHLRKLSRSTGVPIDQMFRKPFESGQKLSGELQQVFAGNPELRNMVDYLKTTDPDGLLLDLVDSPQGLKMKSDVLGLETITRDNKTIIKRGGEEIAEFAGPAQKQIADANAFLDNSDELWPAWVRNSQNKSMNEILNTSPEVEVRTGEYVPEGGRRTINKYLHDYNLHKGSDYSIDPRGDHSQIDALYNIIRRDGYGPKRISRALGERGIKFSDVEEENRAIITQLRSDLDEVVPRTPFIVANKETGKVIPKDKIPRVVLEHPDIETPSYSKNIFTGSPARVRQMLTNLQVKQSDLNRQQAKRASVGGAQYEQISNNEFVELKFRVPDAEGHLHDSILHFNSTKQARDFLTRGKTRGLTSTLDETFPDEGIRREYNKFLKEASKAGKETDFMPFKFAQHEAKQNHFQLGTYRGKYILQDALGSNPEKIYQFDNISSVMTFLRGTDIRQGTPSLTQGVSGSAIEQMIPDGIPDPMRDIPYEEVKRTRRVGIWEHLKTRFFPTQHVVRDMERWQVVDELRQQGMDISPTRFYNQLRDVTRASDAFKSDKNAFTHRLFRGTTTRQRELMTDYMQSFDTEKELAAFGTTANQNLKRTVFNDMVSEFGQVKADELVAKTTELRRMYNDLFNMVGLDADRFLKHYAPRLSKEVELNGGHLGRQVDPKRLVDIPNTDRRAFFEFMRTRDVDPRDIVWERDAQKLAQTYTDLAARRIFIQPATQNIADQLKAMNNQLVQKGSSPREFQRLANYFGNLLHSIDGIDNPNQILADRAVNESISSMAERLSNVLGKEFVRKTQKTNFINTLTTITTGAHLGARVYPLARNLTQSAVTTAPLIGPRWWMEGLDEISSNPGIFRRMQSLGIIDPNAMPTGSGFAVQNSGGILNRAVTLGMTPYKWTDWVNRIITYTGMEKRVDDAIRRLNAGEISTEKFMRLSGARLFGKDNYNQIAHMINTATDRNAALASAKDRLGRLAVENTQWIYDKMNAPEALRSGFGKLAGTYTSWPLNYFNYIRQAITSDSMTVPEKIEILSSSAMVTGAFAYGHHKAGMNPQAFMPWNMATAQPGPYFSLMNNMIMGINGDRQAMNEFVRDISSFAPFAYAGSSLARGIQSAVDGNMWEAFAHLSSAPFKTDVLPRENVFDTGIEEKLLEAGNAWVDGVQGDPFER